MDDLKLKNVSNPIELLASLRAIVEKGIANSAAVTKINKVHETLGGTSYVKQFTSLTGCSLRSGQSNLAEGYLYC